MILTVLPTLAQLQIYARGRPRGMRIPIAIAILLATSAALAQPVPTDGLRIIDGDTVSVGGHQYRVVGCDTPETTRAKCDAERALGDRATVRLEQVVARQTRVARLRGKLRS